jgi:hypothetical protein
MLCMHVCVCVCVCVSVCWGRGDCSVDGDKYLGIIPVIFMVKCCRVEL